MADNQVSPPPPPPPPPPSPQTTTASPTNDVTTTATTTTATTLDATADLRGRNTFEKPLLEKEKSIFIRMMEENQTREDVVEYPRHRLKPEPQEICVCDVKTHHTLV